MSDPWPPGAAWVVLPTYQEAENITAMLGRAARRIRRRGAGRAGCSWSTTAPLTAPPTWPTRSVPRDPRVSVLRRTTKEGIGPAYRAGFRHALDAGAELVLEMDADFSHDPRDVPRLIAAARDADLVLGSRYTPGAASRGGGWCDARSAAAAAGTPGGCWACAVRDLTGGFKCFRRVVLETLPLDEVTAAGYVFQVEVTYRALVAGFRVAEVPITFTDRVLRRVEDEGLDRRRGRHPRSPAAATGPTPALSLRPDRSVPGGPK